MPISRVLHVIPFVKNYLLGLPLK